MFTISRSLVAIACFTCSLTAFGQENSLEELFNSNQETSSEEAAAKEEVSVNGEPLAPVTFEDLPFTEYDLDFREWSDASGKFSVIGKFDGLGDGSVWIIRKDNQKRIEVKIEILAPDDAELVKHIKENMKSVQQIYIDKIFADLERDVNQLLQLRDELEKLAADETLTFEKRKEKQLNAIQQRWPKEPSTYPVRLNSEKKGKWTSTSFGNSPGADLLVPRVWRTKNSPLLLATFDHSYIHDYVIAGRMSAQKVAMKRVSEAYEQGRLEENTLSSALSPLFSNIGLWNPTNRQVGKPSNDFWPNDSFFRVNYPTLLMNREILLGHDRNFERHINLLPDIALTLKPVEAVRAPGFLSSFAWDGGKGEFAFREKVEPIQRSWRNLRRYFGVQYLDSPLASDISGDKDFRDVLWPDAKAIPAAPKLYIKQSDRGEHFIKPEYCFAYFVLGESLSERLKRFGKYCLSLAQEEADALIWDRFSKSKLKNKCVHSLWLRTDGGWQYVHLVDADTIEADEFGVDELKRNSFLFRSSYGKPLFKEEKLTQQQAHKLKLQMIRN